MPVSATARPVTQLADVEVKSASINPRLFPVVAAGDIRRTVPMEIRIKKPIIEARSGKLKKVLEIRIILNMFFLSSLYLPSCRFRTSGC